MPASAAPPKPKGMGVGHPSGDNRFRILEATMKRHQHQPDALIEVLHKAQELFGYLADDLLLHN
jgi:bidirectional [NiFe] hydrogenase diaphorase subunit